MRRRYIKTTAQPVVYVAHRLGRCPRSGDWCTSSCSVQTHESTWKVIVAADTRPEFLRQLGRALAHGENHRIDISGYTDAGRSFESWVWYEMGEDIVDRDAFVRHVGYLLAHGHRLRLYGDTPAGGRSLSRVMAVV